MNKLLIFIGLYLLVGPCWGQQWVYVQSTKAKLYSEPSYASTVIYTVKKSTRLKELKRDGRWVQVNIKNHSAWISMLLIGNRPPLNKMSILENQQDKLQKSSRRRASSASSAAATRGLREEDRSRLNEQQQADYSALEKVEASKVTERDAIEFIQSGSQN